MLAQKGETVNTQNVVGAVNNEKQAQPQQEAKKVLAETGPAKESGAPVVTGQQTKQGEPAVKQGTVLGQTGTKLNEVTNNPTSKSSPSS